MSTRSVRRKKKQPDDPPEIIALTKAKTALDEAESNMHAACACCQIGAPRIDEFEDDSFSRIGAARRQINTAMREIRRRKKSDGAGEK